GQCYWLPLCQGICSGRLYGHAARACTQYLLRDPVPPQHRIALYPSKAQGLCKSCRSRELFERRLTLLPMLTKAYQWPVLLALSIAWIFAFRVIGDYAVWLIPE